jgi:integrase-like protein
MARMVNFSSDGFDQWAFAISRRRRVSPWQNGYAERLIGSIRRECLDHVVVFGERHLRHLLLSYMKYYNGARTHLSLEKDAPFSRAVERAGQILCRPILGGLHHQYVRI